MINNSTSRVCSDSGTRFELLPLWGVEPVTEITAFGGLALILDKAFAPLSTSGVQFWFGRLSSRQIRHFSLLDKGSLPLSEAWEL
jgi:hypothetical protein